MPLSDSEIDRYARQILLRRVGGRGQERLLGAWVEVRGSSPALIDAVAILAASGVRTAPGGQAPDGRAAAFPAPPSPDPMRSADGMPVLLGESGARFAGPGCWICVGSRSGAPALVWKGPSGCESCFGASCAGLEAATTFDEPWTLVVGAAVALAAHRLILGLEDEMGGRTWTPTVELEPLRCVRCPRCAVDAPEAAGG